VEEESGPRRERIGSRQALVTRIGANDEGSWMTSPTRAPERAVATARSGARVRDVIREPASFAPILVTSA
jgi:hypothetical protein